MVTRPPSRSPAARGAGGFSFLPLLAGVGYVGWWWCGGGRLAGRGEEAMRVTALSWTHALCLSHFHVGPTARGCTCDVVRPPVDILANICLGSFYGNIVSFIL